MVSSIKKKYEVPQKNNPEQQRILLSNSGFLLELKTESHYLCFHVRQIQLISTRILVASNMNCRARNISNSKCMENW